MSRSTKPARNAPRYGDGARQPAISPRTAPRTSLRSHVQSFGLAILLALFVRQFFFQAFRIPSPSMENTLLVGDFLFVNKFLYGAKFPFVSARLPAVRPPRRGEIIVFQPPHENRDFIKRCVAIAGDTVLVRAKQLFVNGVPQIEPYTKYTSGLEPPRPGRERDYFGPHVVPPGHMFMMGDNRDNSEDSRFWGDAPLNRIRGKALFIYFSVDGSRGYFPPHLRIRRIGRIIH
jgi:signal peptidase I